MKNLLGVIKIIQPEPIDLNELTRSSDYIRGSGMVKMRDYSKEPLTEEELDLIEEWLKPSSGIYQMEKGNLSLLV